MNKMDNIKLPENHVGKLTPNKTNELISDKLGFKRDSLILGPGPGLDFGVVDCGNGKIMAIAEDPIFPAAGLPLEMMGEFTVHIGASDVAVSGIKPQFMTYSLLLPPGTPVNEVENLIQKISDTCKELEITIAGGHTGWYPAVNIPIIGGVTVWGYADKDDWVSPAGAENGDILLMTKGPSIEAAALLAVLYSQKKTSLSEKTLKSLLNRVSQISVVNDALIAYEAGGVKAMHDATEGGVYGGIWEIMAACGVNLEVNIDDSMVPFDIMEFSKYLDFDPWAAISEGTLLAAVKPESVDKIRNVWKKSGIESFVIGKFSSELKESIITVNGKTDLLSEPGTDPFWNLFDKALS